MAVLPKGVGLDVTLHHVEKPTRTFLIDWSSKQVSGMDEGLPAMRQAVEIILQNERSGGRSIRLILEVNWRTWWEKNGITSKANFPAGSKMHFQETAESLQWKILYLRKKYRES